MSKEKSSSPDSSEAPPAKSRSAKSRSGKPAKPSEKGHSATEEPVVEKSPTSYPVFDLAEPASSNESPKSSTPADAPPQEGGKRKRRRKKGKGAASQNAAQAATADFSPESMEELPTVPQPAKHARPKLDPEGVSKLAWKIYLSEVSEEGVALISDSDAKELTHRCFRLAEIFMEEQARRR